MDDPSEYIDFMAKYKDWISIKRLGITPNTKPEEVVFHMAGIRNTIDLKAFPLLGIKTGPLDAAAGRLTEGKKRNFADLGGAISGLGGADANARRRGSVCRQEGALAHRTGIYDRKGAEQP